MPKITLDISDARYAALRKTQELMLLDGGAATTPEEYLLLVVNGACDSYAAQYADNTPEGLAAQVAIHKDAAARAEAKAAAEEEKAAEAQAKAAALESERVARASLAEQIEAL